MEGIWVFVNPDEPVCQPVIQKINERMGQSENIRLIDARNPQNRPSYVKFVPSVVMAMHGQQQMLEGTPAIEYLDNMLGITRQEDDSKKPFKSGGVGGPVGVGMSPGAAAGTSLGDIGVNPSGSIFKSEESRYMPQQGGITEDEIQRYQTARSRVPDPRTTQQPATVPSYSGGQMCTM